MVKKLAVSEKTQRGVPLTPQGFTNKKFSPLEDTESHVVCFGRAYWLCDQTGGVNKNTVEKWTICIRSVVLRKH